MRTLYRASQVLTLSYPRSGDWLLVDGRHVQRVGTGEPPDADRIVDLPGATIVPGFIDSHVHLTGTGINHANPEVGRARSAAELVEVVRRVASAREGPTLVHGYDESMWPRPESPSLAELDAASPRPLAVVRVDGHLTLANTPALSGAGVLEMAGVERDASGAPSGRVTRDANDQLKRWFHEHLADREIEELQLMAASLAASRGVTCVHEMSLPKERGLRDLKILLDHRSMLPIDVVTYVATTDIPQVIDLKLPRIGGDLPLDGSIGARTARVSEPYVGGEGSGVSYHGDDQLAEFLHDAHLAGLQVGVHAIGDLAIEQVVATWERVYHALDSRGRRHFRARRHRIEHFEMASSEQMERAAMLGLAISVQPAFDALWGHPGGLYDQRLGWERAAGMNPFRTFLERGIEVGAGSDSPITSLDPMEAVSGFEQHHDPAQRLAREEAIRLCTQGSARLAHLDEKKGSLEPGMHADFAAFEESPLAAEAVRGLRPIFTVSLGREVFAA